MKKLLLLSSLGFIFLNSSFASPGRLSLDDVPFNLCDSTGKLLINKILFLKPEDKVRIKIKDVEYCGLVLEKVEENKKFVKIIGQLFKEKETKKKQDEVGFGFYLDFNGKFIGTILNNTTGQEWQFEYMDSVKGFVLVEQYKNPEKFIL